MTTEGYKRNPDGSFVDKYEEEHRQARIKHYYDTLKNSYVPDLSELFVGYKCMRCMYSSHVDGSPGKRYCEQILSLESLKSLDKERLSDGMWHDIRTMYLTKCQLEEDGWVSSDSQKYEKCGEAYMHTKDGWYLEFNATSDDPNKRKINLGTSPFGVYQVGYKGYHGPCKSINEFRKIFKCLSTG